MNDLEINKCYQGTRSFNVAIKKAIIHKAEKEKIKIRTLENQIKEIKTNLEELEKKTQELQEQENEEHRILDNTTNSFINPVKYWNEWGSIQKVYGHKCLELLENYF